jgi:3-isopropylmalate dehydrogenase
MMLEYSFGASEASNAVKQAVTRALDEGYRTSDIKTGAGKVVSTTEMGDVIVNFI